jgi:hypothetical protein
MFGWCTVTRGKLLGKLSGEGEASGDVRDTHQQWTEVTKGQVACINGNKGLQNSAIKLVLRDL